MPATTGTSAHATVRLWTSGIVLSADEACSADDKAGAGRRLALARRQCDQRGAGGAVWAEGRCASTSRPAHRTDTARLPRLAGTRAGSPSRSSTARHRLARVSSPPLGHRRDDEADPTPPGDRSTAKVAELNRGDVVTHWADLAPADRCGEVTSPLRTVRGAGSATIRRVVDSADSRPGSALESLLRGVLLEAGLDTFEPQVIIRDVTFFSPVDLVDPVARLAPEADSFTHHGYREALSRDCWRYDELAIAAGPSCALPQNA